MRIELVVLAAVAVVALTVAWWLTSPRYIGWLVARRLRRLRSAARSLYPMLTEEEDPVSRIVIVNRAESSPLPTQRCASPPPGETTIHLPSPARGD